MAETGALNAAGEDDDISPAAGASVGRLVCDPGDGPAGALLWLAPAWTGLERAGVAGQGPEEPLGVGATTERGGSQAGGKEGGSAMGIG
jgi:hypothetical protein